MYIDKLDEFAEVAACGTAAGTPFYVIVDKDKVIYLMDTEEVSFVYTVLSKIMNDFQVGSVKLNNIWFIIVR